MLTLESALHSMLGALVLLLQQTGLLNVLIHCQSSPVAPGQLASLLGAPASSWPKYTRLWLSCDRSHTHFQRVHVHVLHAYGMHVATATCMPYACACMAVELCMIRLSITHSSPLTWLIKTLPFRSRLDFRLGVVQTHHRASSVVVKPWPCRASKLRSLWTNTKAEEVTLPASSLQLHLPVPPHMHSPQASSRPRDRKAGPPRRPKSSRRKRNRHRGLGTFRS